MIRLAGVFFLFVLYGLSAGGLTAVWTFWPLCLIILPTGLDRLFVGSLYFSYDRVIGLGSLLILLTVPGRIVRARFRFLDGVVVAMIACDMISLTTNMGFRPLAVIQFPLFYLPYLLGRFYLRDVGDMRRAVGGMVAVLLLGAVLAGIEAVLRVQPIMLLSKGRNELDEIRHGLMRARVGSSGPISLGTTILLMMPWAYDAARRARLGAGPARWRAAPALGVAMLITTMSRGPILAFATFPIVHFYFRRPRMRRLVAVSALAVAAVVLTAKDQVVGLMHSLQVAASGGVDTSSSIIIDGELHVYNGTTHRTLLYKVYREPMRQAGFFGYDMNWGGTISPYLQRRFSSVDNAYIVMRLKRGLVGILALDLMIAGTLLSAWRTAKDEDHPMSYFAERLVAAVIGLTLALFTVDLFFESRAILLMSAGLAAWLEDARARDRVGGEWEEHDWPDDEDDPREGYAASDRAAAQHIGP